MDPAVQHVFEELNPPSAARLKREPRARGMPYKAKAVDADVRRSEAIQLQAHTQFKYTGTIMSTVINARLAAELNDYTATPKGDNPKIEETS